MAALLFECSAAAEGDGEHENRYDPPAAQSACPVSSRDFVMLALATPCRIPIASGRARPSSSTASRTCLTLRAYGAVRRRRPRFMVASSRAFRVDNPPTCSSPTCTRITRSGSRRSSCSRGIRSRHVHGSLRPPDHAPRRCHPRLPARHDRTRSRQGPDHDWAWLEGPWA